jgi:hypothetical protein
MIRNLTVVEVCISGMRGFQIRGLIRACSDSLWEPIAHAAVFRSAERAERFLQKKRGAAPLNWSAWGVPQDHVVSDTDAFQHYAAPFSVI